MRSCSLSVNPSRTTPSSTAVTAGVRATGSHRRGAAFQRLTIVWRRKPEVGEDRRLERHDRAALLDRDTYFLGTDRRQHPARLRLHVTADPATR